MTENTAVVIAILMFVVMFAAFLLAGHTVMANGVQLNQTIWGPIGWMVP